MCRFIETIRVDCGEVRNTAYHERRMNDTRTHFWPESPALQLAGYLPAIPGSGVHKLRIVYGQNGIEEVTCTPYTAPMRSARWARYFRTAELSLSIVPFEVMKAITPPGRILSSVFPRK